MIANICGIFIFMGLSLSPGLFLGELRFLFLVLRFQVIPEPRRYAGGELQPISAFVTDWLLSLENTDQFLDRKARPDGELLLCHFE